MAEQPEDLTDEEMAMLKFEAKGWIHRGAKESAMRDEFHLTPTKYYQQLSWLIEKPAAAEFDPTLVGRLVRLRDEGIARKRVRGV